MNEITNPNQEGVLTESRERERERERGAESNQRERRGWVKSECEEKRESDESTKDLWRRVHLA